VPVPYKREVTLRHEGLPTEDQIGFAISISGGHNINERFLKKTKNLWNHFFEIPACGRQVCNQRAESSFSELSMKKIELREGLRR